jgi:hypothetical protein
MGISELLLRVNEPLQSVLLLLKVPQPFQQPEQVGPQDFQPRFAHYVGAFQDYEFVHQEEYFQGEVHFLVAEACSLM